MRNFQNLPRQTQLKMLETVRKQVNHRRRNQIWTWFNTPEVRATYPKQMQFFEMGKFHQERGLFGGNRTGKTHCGVYEDTMHLTGIYQDWWPGKRFTRPVDAWAATDISKNTRDILQEKFCGKPGSEGSLGTGMIPADLILNTTIKHGLANAFETVFIRHVPTGGVSTLQFKSYDQGREAFQGTAQHLIHLDEEPPLDVYVECLLRIMTTNGLLILTETPLLGVSDLMCEFMPELKPSPDAAPAVETWDESSPEEILLDESTI
jgi:phage terminase large subunit-like protein